MNVELREIVAVNISLQTAPITRVGFGTPLLVTTHAQFAPRTKIYSSLESVVADGFATSSETYKMVAAALAVPNPPAVIKVGRKDAGETWAAAITAILTADNDWYGLAIESRTKSHIQLVSPVAEAAQKLFFAATADAEVLVDATLTDVVNANKVAANRRTGIIFHTLAAANYPEVSILSQQLAKDPGVSTWEFKTLNTIPADIALTTANRSTLRTKRGGFYTIVSGRNVTQNIVMGDANFPDIIHGIDWLQMRLQEDIFFQLVNTEKVPYTNAGLALIQNVIEKRLNNAITQGVLAPELEAGFSKAYRITIPDVLDINANDRAQRLLQDVKFEARVAGAIHKLIIRGTITV